MNKLAQKVALAVVGASALIAGPVAAEYPEKPVSFVVPWPPGDLEDVLTRLIAEEFQETYGVPAAVVNKPGGGGGPFPGAVSVATAPADGYTVGSFVIGVPVIGPDIGIPELNPNPFDPLGIFLTYPFVIAASKNDNYSSMEELAAYAKDNDVTLGHFGSFLPPTKVTFALAKNMGFDFAAETAFDNVDCNVLASGDVDVINTTIQQISACRDDVVILASIGGARTSQTPDVPTVSEIDPSLQLALWNGLFVHKDTPADVREKIIAVAQKALQSDEASELAERTGALIYWQDAEASNAQIQSDRDSFAAIEKLLGE
ncbi:tripartite tricarboxylate transporter substrate-binding protein [Roseibium sp. RKSG952]|uniref:tripartite tricarboxylate transporter substrate-binding protein n=1 Tax=Roseibium sp. RKSG952 TaxID=2529384 RepID=UPI0012BC3381|nr:tripartite tricarboxylate transporter substrate-binding protein [Roseibium sp. RKSG952]MTH98992.1 tripartite tricarboxylate transporter substrate binding protein [Roseibium sp. RKSG952]